MSDKHINIGIEEQFDINEEHIEFIISDLEYKSIFYKVSETLNILSKKNNNELLKTFVANVQETCQIPSLLIDTIITIYKTEFKIILEFNEHLEFIIKLINELYVVNIYEDELNQVKILLKDSMNFYQSEIKYFNSIKINFPLKLLNDIRKGMIRYNKSKNQRIEYWLFCNKYIKNFDIFCFISMTIDMKQHIGCFDNSQFTFDSTDKVILISKLQNSMEKIKIILEPIENLEIINKFNNISLLKEKFLYFLKDYKYEYTAFIDSLITYKNIMSHKLKNKIYDKMFLYKSKKDINYIDNTITNCDAQIKFFCAYIHIIKLIENFIQSNNKINIISYWYEKVIKFIENINKLYYSVIRPKIMPDILELTREYYL